MMPNTQTNSDFIFRDHPEIGRLLSHPMFTGLLMGASVWLSTMLSGYSQDISALWFANAVVFMWVLPLPVRRLPSHLASAAAANIAIALLYHHHDFLAFISVACNMAEIILMLQLTRRYYDVSTRLFRISALRFTCLSFAVVGAVCITMTPLLIHRRQPDILTAVPNWFFSDVLGMLLVSALVGFWRRRTYSPAFRLSQLEGTLLCILAVLGVTCVAFQQDGYPVLFIIYPTLIFVVFKRGIAIALLCVALHGALAAALTLHGLGPLDDLQHPTPLHSVLFLQVYLFILLATVYPVGRVLYMREKLSSLYSLVTDHSGDIISRASMDGIRQYCSPSVTRILGWTPEEMCNVEATTLYHPDDVPRFQELFRKMNEGRSKPAVIAFRARTKSGDFLWMETHISVVSDPISGKAAGIIASSRDISERVAAEARLQSAYRALQQVASTDALTGLANRRAFDEALEREWRRARRERTPLAVLMLDVDFFKRYNDALGHQAGDEALRRIARCLQQVVQRPSDLVVRYGGEEFVALLPFTEAPGAQQLAQRISDAVADAAIPHPDSPLRDLLTLSIGVGSIFPSLGYSPADLIASADGALYLAKENGRNRIELAPPLLQAPAQQPLQTPAEHGANQTSDAGQISEEDAEALLAFPLL